MEQDDRIWCHNNALHGVCLQLYLFALIENYGDYNILTLTIRASSSRSYLSENDKIPAVSVSESELLSTEAWRNNSARYNSG